jgi:hypothetical protein
MPKAVIISGLLTHLSDNIIPFLDKETDVYCHTWNIDWNGRWLIKLNRYKKYCRNLYTVMDKPQFHSKRHSYFYSTYRVVNMIKDIYSYEKIIKFKPNVIGDVKYVGDLDYYFKKAYLQSRPLLNDIKKEECLYGTIHYTTMDERIFTGFPLAFSKMFHTLEESFVQQMMITDLDVKKKYGTDSEGSIFWKEWADKNGVKFIQDIDLTIPDSKPWQH